MESRYPKKSYKWFAVWFVILAVSLAYVSSQQASMPLFGRAQDVGLLLCLLMDLLFWIIYVTEHIYWINGVTYEEAARAGKKARKRYAWRHLRVFLGATAAYLLYCLLEGRYLRPGTELRDAMTAAGVLCAAAVLTVPIKLSDGKETVQHS